MNPFLRFALVLLLAYCLTCVLLYLFQTRLIFVPQPVWHEPSGPHVEPVSVERNVITLRGWTVNPNSDGPVVIYFGGNGEELSRVVEPFAGLHATTVLINYRGYGDSDGTPASVDLIADARHLVGVMHRRLGEHRPLILFGRSLGTGIAVQAASTTPVDGVILLSPYRSLAHLGRRLLPFLPLRWLFRHDIDAAAAIPTLPDRVLVLHGTFDVVVPAAESRAFVALFDEPPQVVEFDAGHNVPLLDPQIWESIETFVEEVGD